MPAPHKSGWPALAILCGSGFCGWVIGYSYLLNSTVFFYDGCIGLFALSWVAKLRWRRHPAVQIGANTLILLILLLPVAEAVFAFKLDRARRRLRPPVATDRIYSFEVARGDPAQFAWWWSRMLEELNRLSRQILARDPQHKLPFILKPDSVGNFFNSEIRVNGLGFRDREFAVAKTNQYRIVALGESTTMGLTLLPSDRPWPVVLEGLIRERIPGPRPVEVINAGVASYNLQDGLERLRRDVLPLKPDLILVYHGYNGFHFLDDTLDEAELTSLQATPPRFVERPSLLLAQGEYRVRLLRFRRAHFRSNLSPAALARRQAVVMNSTCARLYGELISLARTNGIQLVLLNHNLAVHDQSPPAVIRFYEGGFPDVKYRVQANRLHSFLLEQLGRQNPDVLCLDVNPGLDGCYDQFIDLVHLTQAGRDQLAENVCNGIRNFLRPESLSPLHPPHP